MTDEELLREAIKVVVEAKEASTSLLQRKLNIGYGKAAQLIEKMQEIKVISPLETIKIHRVYFTDYKEALDRVSDAGN